MFAQPTAPQPTPPQLTTKQPGGEADGQFGRGDQGQGGSRGSEAVDGRIGAESEQRAPAVTNDPIDLTEDDIQEALAPSGLHIEEDDASGSELGDDNYVDDDDEDEDDDASNVAPLEEELEQEASTEYGQGAPLAANGQSLTSNMNNGGSTFSQHAPTTANRQVGEGMTVTLMPHQVLGVNWMPQREAANKPGGGILADDMGLGKTIQVIGTVLADREDYDPTLIVVPLSLLGQWELEIGQKTTDGGLTSLVYYGEARKTSSNFTSYDIVLTTYETLTLQFSEYSNGKSQTSIENKGPLGKQQWRRVVLEEVARIRNHETQVAKACFSLRANYRWVLSGTLIVNKLADMFSYMHFLRLGKYRNLVDFKKWIIEPAKTDPVPALASRMQW